MLQGFVATHFQIEIFCPNIVAIHRHLLLFWHGLIEVQLVGARATVVLRICPVGFGQLCTLFVFDVVALVCATAAALLLVLHVCVKLFHQVAKGILNLKS